MAATPTDGSAGADNKPVAAIRSDGKLVLMGSNTPEQTAVLSVPLRTGRWYFLVLHGLNGARRRQELHLYDGVSGIRLGTTSQVFDVTGSFVNGITKWGFGTPQDADDSGGDGGGPK